MHYGAPATRHPARSPQDKPLAIRGCHVCTQPVTTSSQGNVRSQRRGRLLSRTMECDHPSSLHDQSVSSRTTRGLRCAYARRRPTTRWTGSHAPGSGKGRPSSRAFSIATATSGASRLRATTSVAAGEPVVHDPSKHDKGSQPTAPMTEVPGKVRLEHAPPMADGVGIFFRILDEPRCARLPTIPVEQGRLVPAGRRRNRDHCLPPC
jgi:hypothetical protein